MRSVNAKKRKEKLFLFPRNVSKLNIKAKRIVTIPYPNEPLEEGDKLVLDAVSICTANEESEDVSEDQEDQAEDLSTTHLDRKISPFDEAILEKVGVHNSDRYFELLGVANDLLPKFRSQDDAVQRVGTRASPSPLDAAIVAKLGAHSADFLYEVKSAISECQHLIGSHEDEGSSSDEDDEGEDVDGEREVAVASPSVDVDVDAPITPTETPPGPNIPVHNPMELLELAGSKLEDACNGGHPQLVEGDQANSLNPKTVASTSPKVFATSGAQIATPDHVPQSHDVPKTVVADFSPISSHVKKQTLLAVGTKPKPAIPFFNNPSGAQPQAPVNGCHVASTFCPVGSQQYCDGDGSQHSESSSASQDLVGPTDLSNNYEGNKRSMPIHIGGALPYESRLQQHDDDGRCSRAFNVVHHQVVPTAPREEIISAPLQSWSDGSFIAPNAFTAQGTVHDRVSLDVGPQRTGVGMVGMQPSATGMANPAVSMANPAKLIPSDYLGQPKIGISETWSTPCGNAEHAQADQQPNRTWAGLFKPSVLGDNLAHTDLGCCHPDKTINSCLKVTHKGKAPLPFNLEFVDHGEIATNLILKIPKDITVAGKEEWGSTLVGRTMGRKLPYSLITKVTDRLWANDGLIDTLATDSGYYFFTFSSVETRDAILEGGPWFVAGQPLLLRPWKPHFSFQNEEIHSIPIWVNFYGIPLEYWNSKGLSFISSFIGKPIRVDSITASRRRITYARVCIEVTADFDFFKEFHIESEDEVSGGTIRTQINLEYQWMPVRCKQCSQFGHDCSRIAKPEPRPTVHHPNPRKGQGEETWQVVKKKDKGKKIIDYLAPRPKNTVQLKGIEVKGNKFEALTQLLEESDDTSSVRMNCNATRSTLQATRVGIREDPTCSMSVDKVIDYASDSSQEEGGWSPAVGSPLSNKQRKREEKMKFSGSRPKGRHRS